MVTWKLVGWLRTTLASVLALAPLAAPHRGPAGAGVATSELAIDVDGDGRADRVRWTRHDDAFWLDVELAARSDAEGALAPRSTTRVVPVADGSCWTVSAADVNGDGRMDVLVRDARGHTMVWVSDGLAFEPAARSGPGCVATAQPTEGAKR